MGHGDSIAKPGLEAFHNLIRKGNFRYQDHDLFSIPQSLIGQAQIDLGLTASGHPTQKKRMERSPLAADFDGIDGRLLLIGKDHFIPGSSVRMVAVTQDPLLSFGKDAF